MTLQEKLIFKFLITALIVGLITGWVRDNVFYNSPDRTEEGRILANKIASINENERLNHTVKEKLSQITKSANEKKVSSEIDFPKVNLNSATKYELTTLPGIGPAIAERIIVYREDYGNFKTIEDLMRVKGIGKKIVERIRESITI